MDIFRCATFPIPQSIGIYKQSKLGAYGPKISAATQVGAAGPSEKQFMAKQKFREWTIAHIAKDQTLSKKMKQKVEKDLI